MLEEVEILCMQATQYNTSYGVVRPQSIIMCIDAERPKIPGVEGAGRQAIRRFELMCWHAGSAGAPGLWTRGGEDEWREEPKVDEGLKLLSQMTVARATQTSWGLSLRDLRVRCALVSRPSSSSKPPPVARHPGPLDPGFKAQTFAVRGGVARTAAKARHST